MVRSRTALRDSLLALLEEKPFDQITIREITVRAHVGYATFFRHYSTKDALLHDLAAHEIGELLGLAVPVLSTTGSRDSCLAMCAYINERRALWSALLTGGAAATLRDEFIQQARQLAAGRQLQSWLPGDLSIIFPTGATIDLLAWWLGQDEHYSVEQIAEIMDRLVIAPTLRQVMRSDLGTAPPLDGARHNAL